MSDIDGPWLWRIIPFAKGVRPMNIAVNLKLTRKDLVNFAIAHVYRRKLVLGIAALAVQLTVA